MTTRRAIRALIGPLTAVAMLALPAPAPAPAAPTGGLTVIAANYGANTLTTYAASSGYALDEKVSATTGHSLSNPAGIALAENGDVWVANADGDTVVEYTQSQLASGGSPDPAVTISATGSGSAASLDGPAALAFDASGDLWVANRYNDTLVEYTASQLATGGSLEPEVTISSTDLDQPVALAFDAGGDLWAASLDNDDVLEYAGSELTKSRSLAPEVTLGAGSPGGPDGLAFDAAGDLWVASFDANAVVEYSGSQLVNGGSPSPVIAIASYDSSLQGPAGLAFDAAGDLWVANNDGASVVEYSPSQLALGGAAQTPIETISGGSSDLSNPTGLVLAEAPTVASISTRAGPRGTAVTITGTGFHPSSKVDFGAAAASSVTYVSPDQLRVVAPAGSGTVDITVATGLGTSATSSADRFTYGATAAVTPTVVVANGGDSTLTGYPLAASGDAEPSTAITPQSSSGLSEPGEPAFDADGDLWVPSSYDNTVAEYTPSQLAVEGDPTPELTLSDQDGSLDGPAAVALDAAGDLWVANQDSNTVVEYTRQELAAGGTALAPKLTIGSAGDSLDGPDGLGFDAAGDLWVANRTNDTVVELAAGGLSASGSPAAAVTLSGSANLSAPQGLAFDAAGDLWVADYGTDSIVEYDGALLHEGGNVAPTQTLDESVGAEPQGIAFDGAGDLWVANGGDGTVDEYSPSELADGGSESATAAITGGSTGLSAPAGVAIEEPPAVTGISTYTGPKGTTITIDGAGFLPGATVRFGTRAATSASYLDADRLTAVAPAGSGTVDVAVATGAGTSATSSADRFTYAAHADVTPMLVTSNNLIGLTRGTLTGYPLSASGDSAPLTTVQPSTSGSLDEPGPVALDASGDLWVINEAGNTVSEYTPRELADGGDPSPKVTLTVAGEANALAFDQHGNLWVACYEGLFEYPQSELASSGSPAPKVSIGPSDDSLDLPYAIAFDAAGNLWIANDENGTVVELSAKDLTASGSPAAAVTIDGVSGADGLAFDAAGDLWVAAYNDNAIAEYPASELHAGATPAATVSIGSGKPAALAFDAAGNLWVAELGDNALVEYARRDLGSSGASPVDTISGTSTDLAQPWGLAIEQTPTVASVSPADGNRSTKVTIHGTGFYPGATVDFGGTPATSVGYVSRYELTAVAPAGKGPVDVTVTTGEGTSATSKADRFGYPQPRVELTSRELKVSGARVAASLRCLVAACDGTLRLTERTVTRVRRDGRTVRRVRTTLLVSARYAVRAGHRATIRASLRRAGRDALAHAAGGRLRARITITVTGGATRSAAVTLLG